MRFTQVKTHARHPEALAQFYVDGLGCEVIRPLTLLEEPAPSAVGPSATAVSILVLTLPGLDDGPHSSC
jgi:hypothetical protein